MDGQFRIDHFIRLTRATLKVLKQYAPFNILAETPTPSLVLVQEVNELFLVWGALPRGISLSETGDFLNALRYFSIVFDHEWKSHLSQWFQVNAPEFDLQWLEHFEFLGSMCSEANKRFIAAKNADEHVSPDPLNEYFREQMEKAQSAVSLLDFSLIELEKFTYDVFPEKPPKEWSELLGKSSKQLGRYLKDGTIRGWAVTEKRWRIHRDEIPTS